MTDAINAGDDSDRLLVDLGRAPARARPCHATARDVAGTADRLVPTPDDVVELRRTDPSAVARWRAAHPRRARPTALAEGRPIVGFTRAGEYVIGSTP